MWKKLKLQANNFALESDDVTDGNSKCNSSQIHADSACATSVLLLPEVRKKGRNLANTVCPCFGVPTCRRTASSWRIHVNPLPDVPYWPVVIEAVVGPAYILIITAYPAR
jgi:hypothetical protein